MLESFSPECPQELCRKVMTPCYLIAEDIIEENCRLLQNVQERSGAKILLALKAFALPAVFEIMRKYLAGVCASGPVEAQLGRDEFGKEVHTYAPAYTFEQLRRVAEYSDHIVFNSLGQWQRYREYLQEFVVKSGRKLQFGLRLNPEYSEVGTDLYNPCVVGSRFGIREETLLGADIAGISGLHFHALCEQGADVLERVLEQVEQRFGWLLQDERITWVNFGGGHHITRSDYQVDLLCSLITKFKDKYKVEVYLEPGEAVVLDAGYYLCSVLDIIENGMHVAVVDGSAETHIPDVLAMPYRPELLGSGQWGELGYDYRLGGISCLAGDVIGDYSFTQELAAGDRLCFTDMALYSFVKNNTFNGVELPAIYVYSLKNKRLDLVWEFGYQDYKARISAKEF